jgi:hypothetical protein
MRILLSTILAVAATLGAAPAAGASPEDAGRAELQVYLLTMDQGDEVWERFGHNAILIRDEDTGEAVTWNWGLFDFAQVDFLPRFLRGEMLYSMGPAPFQPFVDSYVRADRSVYLNEIHLTPEQARELDGFVRWNYLPENRDYHYDYYRDNCSTRVRDVLDLVLGGLIRDEFGDRLTERTYRWHSRRLVQATLWLDQGLSLLLGSRGDRPITEWEAMFVPMELMALLEGMEVNDGAGGTRPLLGPREVLFQSSRPPTPDHAPAFSPVWLVGGLLLAGLGGLLGWSAGGREGGRARIAFGVLGGLWGAFAGLLGLLMVLAWFTDHVFIHRNVNILYTNPLLLLLGPALLAVTLRERWFGGRPGALVGWGMLVVAALSLVAALLQAVGIVHQGNAEVIALALPMNVGLAAGLWLGISPRRPPGDRLDLASGAPRGRQGAQSKGVWRR